MLCQILIPLLYLGTAAATSAGCPSDYLSRLESCGRNVDLLMRSPPEGRRQHCSGAERGLSCVRDLINKCGQTHPTAFAQIETGIVYIDMYFESYCSVRSSAPPCPADFQQIMNWSIVSSRQNLRRIYGGVRLTPPQCNELKRDLDSLERVYNSCPDEPEVIETAESVPIGISKWMARTQCPRI